MPDLGDPQSLNRYTCAGNSPVVHNDPSGHWLESSIDIAFLAYDVYDLQQNGTVTELKKLRRGKGVEVHHIVEQRFVENLGIEKADDVLGVVLTYEEHVRFTNEWRKRIGYNNQNF